MDQLTITLGNGETLLDGVLKGGAALSHECGGKLACATCCVVIDQGREALNRPSEDELDLLDRAGVVADGARLACQAFGVGEVVVRVPRLEAPSPQRSMLPIVFTADASVFLRVQLRKHPGSIGMRLAVTPAGCSGLRYRVDPVETVGAHDVMLECGGLRVVVDPVSLPFIQGCTVRLAREGLARRLRFDNPNARQSCGCGESFRT
jgi:iron-sulfur cluster assembly protein